MGTSSVPRTRDFREGRIRPLSKPVPYPMKSFDPVDYLYGAIVLLLVATTAGLYAVIAAVAV